MSHKDAFDHLEKVENNQHVLMASDKGFQWHGIVTYHNGYYTLEFDNGTCTKEYTYSREGIQTLLKGHRLVLVDFSEGHYLFTGLSFEDAE